MQKSSSKISLKFLTDLELRKQNETVLRIILEKLDISNINTLETIAKSELAFRYPKVLDEYILMGYAKHPETTVDKALAILEKYSASKENRGYSHLAFRAAQHLLLISKHDAGNIIMRHNTATVDDVLTRAQVIINASESKYRSLVEETFVEGLPPNIPNPKPFTLTQKAIQQANSRIAKLRNADWGLRVEI